mmetsp:Transcript_21578/g.41945  ORF Transcript_21578/g.41945 Transcript_21578/m.41945 type:complete len:203 (+) Transcript_21578:542-1150(+)
MPTSGAGGACDGAAVPGLDRRRRVWGSRPEATTGHSAGQQHAPGHLRHAFHHRGHAGRGLRAAQQGGAGLPPREAALSRSRKRGPTRANLPPGPGTGRCHGYARRAHGPECGRVPDQRAGAGVARRVGGFGRGKPPASGQNSLAHATAGLHQLRPLSRRFGGAPPQRRLRLGTRPLLPPAGRRHPSAAAPQRHGTLDLPHRR